MTIRSPVVQAYIEHELEQMKGKDIVYYTPVPLIQFLESIRSAKSVRVITDHNEQGEDK